jgi:predicted flavoprotein YhiN
MAELTGTADLNWADLRTSDLDALRSSVAEWQTPVTGKSTFKDEFVTAGGVDLKQINFKTMEHKTLKGLFFAGEVLDIDAITGGFNFQAAWTTSWIAAESIP